MMGRELAIRRGSLGPGLSLVVIGVVGLWLGLGYGLGDWMRVGAGAFPVLVAVVLIVSGLLICLDEYFGRSVPVAIPFGILRAATGLVGSILVFGLTIERLGLIPATALCALVISLSSRAVRLKHVIGLVLVLPVASWLVFTVALGLQAPAFR